MARVSTKSKTAQPNLDSAPIDVGSLLFAGLRAKIDDGRIDTRDKAGILRGGSAGLVLEDGRVGAGCVREAHARYLGAEPARDSGWEMRQLMFEAGNTNEDSWAENLLRGLATLQPGWTLKREEEFPIEWTVDGVRGTGREDIVLVDPDGTPRQLVELKLVSSLGTAIDVLCRVSPKMDHIVQAANYSYRSGLPVQLWYANRFDIAVPDWKWASEHFPADASDRAHPAAEYLDWSRGYTNKQGKYSPPKPTKIKQFVVGFDVAFDSDGRAWYREVGSTGEWKRTVVTKAGIDAFYSRVVSLQKDGLGDRPTVVQSDGRAGTYSKCAYCDWAYACEEAEAASAVPHERYEIFIQIAAANVPLKDERSEE